MTQTDTTNPFLSAAITTVTDLINQANAAAERVGNADNSAKLVHEVRNTSDDPKIVEFRDWFEKANTKILQMEQQIDSYIVQQGLVDTTPVDIEAEKESFKNFDTQIKGMLGALKVIPGGEDAISQLPDRKHIAGQRGAKAGSGSGVKRPRISAITLTKPDGSSQDIYENIVDPKTKETKTVSNLTTLSKWFGTKDNGGHKVEVSALQSALFDAAKTDDLSSLAGKPVQFSFNVADENYMVTVTPTMK